MAPSGALGQPHEITSTASLVVPADPSGQRAAAAGAAILKAAVQAAPQLRWIDPAQALEGAPAPSSAPALVEARRALRQGREAYDALRLREASRQLRIAVEQLRGTGGPGRADLEEALSYLGAAQVLSGETAAGERSFQALLSLNSEAELKDAPPAVEQSFQRALRAQQGAASAQLEVYTTPAYAAVFIDGRFRGVSPIALKELPPGEHELRLEKLGYLSEITPLPLRPGQQAASQIRMRSLARGPELRDLAARAAATQPGEQMSAPLAGLRRALGAERTIFVTVSQSGEDVSFRGAIYQGETRVAEEVTVLSSRSPAFLDALRAYAERLVRKNEDRRSAPDALSLAGAPAAASTEQLDWGQRPPKKKGHTRQLFGWGLVGLGGAAVVNGVVFGVLTQRTHSDYEATAQGSSELQRLRDKGKTQAMVADISYVAGAAALLGGAALLWWPSEDEPEGFLDAGLQPLDGGAYVSLGGSF